MIRVVKDWLPSDLNKFLLKKFLYYTPHMFGHTSHKDDLRHQFYQYEFASDDSLMTYLCQKLHNDVFKDNYIEILRVYINVQHQGMIGDFHIDEGTHTGLYFPCETNDNGGQFEIKNENNELDVVPYIQNQLVIFNANHLHRGMPFNNNKPRITLAFKIIKRT
jgi:hypothetical protein